MTQLPIIQRKLSFLPTLRSTMLLVQVVGLSRLVKTVVSAAPKGQGSVIATRQTDAAFRC